MPVETAISTEREKAMPNPVSVEFPQIFGIVRGITGRRDSRRRRNRGGTDRPSRRGWRRVEAKEEEPLGLIDFGERNPLLDLDFCEMGIRRGASPEEYVRAYQTYRMCYGDSLGEFLAHFQRLWWDVAFHGSVTGYDGIVLLLSLLPDGWREWATMVAEEYIVTAYPAYDLVGDFPRFLSVVFTRFVCYGSVSPLLIDSQVPKVHDPLAPMAPGRPSQWESEAGPSRPLVGHRTPTLPRAPPAHPPSSRDPTLLIETEREAHEAARKGKAPIADSEEDEEEGPPVVAPVGSSR
ncbi:hypothetical protein SASPL_111926 [Salvia splendens]|uniref:Uncharacterized protein n=1 Tax=Salvia splendens TaxID=180675 RepID=A0A8X8Y796_SALSN|nr:hypothetical protein SASPL_111926 [Salvia splendens]